MIPFTQYLRPDGRRREGGFDRSPDVEAIAQSFIDMGGRFTAEVLPNGHVVLSAEWKDEDIAIEISTNDFDLGNAVDQLVLKAKERAV